MARSAFGGTIADWLFKPYSFGSETTLAELATGATVLTFHSAQTGGTQYTDLLVGGVAATSVTATGHQVPQFQGPDGITAMWVDKENDATPRELMEARDLAAIAAAQATIEDLVDDAIAANPTNLATYNVLPGNTAAQNATGFANAAASGDTNFWLPDGTYNIVKTEGQSLMSFSGVNGVKVRGDGAILNDTTTYTNGGAFTTMFLFDNCDDFEVSGIEYVGPTIGTPGTNHGYQGAIFVRAVTGCNGGQVDARLTNLRYGFQTGEYGDATKGDCRNFDVKVRGTMIGYPIAAYYAEGIRFDIDADGVHRTAYLAGCRDVRGTARWKNTYIASPTILLTDALISGTDAAAQVAPPADPTTSRGCSDIDITSIEGASTVWAAGGQFCAGITLSRVDAVQFRNIQVRVLSVAASDSVSPNTGAFLVDSAAKSVWNRYPFNWESTILIENVDVSGLVDHSAATVAGQDFYLVAFEGTHAATIRNFRSDRLSIIPSSAGGQVRLTAGMRDDPWALESGQSTLPRGDISSVANVNTSGVMRLGFFVCTQAFVTTQAKVISGSTAAGATPSLVKLALFTVRPNGDLVRVAVTANDTALLAAANTAYTKAWTAAYTMVPGQAYAAGFLIVTAAATPTLVGQALVSTLDALVSPRMCGIVSDTDIAASYSNAVVAVNGQRPYIAILP